MHLLSSLIFAKMLLVVLDQLLNLLLELLLRDLLARGEPSLT